jgi:phage shock protein A
MDDRLAALTREIEELLEAPTAPPERVEDTLTTGYARALELETRRARLERRIGETERELEVLRTLLASLRRRT